MTDPLFSLIILVHKSSHLLPQTLDSLKPQKPFFEVILFGPNSLKELVRRYSELQIRLEPAGAKLGEMMNRGMNLSRGKYIQYLEPGDHYISQYGLEFLSQLTLQEPPLISASGLSHNTQTHWFLKKKIIELGGFDEHLRFRPLFDLLCRLQKQNTETLFCRRVLIDSTKKTESSFLENYRILHRHFGPWQALKQLFVQSHLLQRTGAFLKKAFCRTT